ncbi:MAG: ABC transporter ATP-binding protein [Bacteroidota bacterium]
MIELADISKIDNEETTLYPITRKIAEGTRLGIVGETGAGKSTLLKIMAGLEHPDSGELFFRGEKILGPKEKLVAGHQKIAYLSQHFELPKFISVREFLNRSVQVGETRANSLFKACDILDLLDNETRALSGGEKQRVALAQVITTSPELLILDEPFSNLDQLHKRTIRKTLHHLSQSFVPTMILVSHDPIDVMSWADEIWVLKGGKLVQVGNPKELYYRPKNKYVAGLFGPYSLISNVGLKSDKQDHFKKIGQRYLVRPGQIQLKEAEPKRQGIVQEVLFKGSYDELFIVSEKETLIVYSEPDRYNVLDVVPISISVLPY